MKQVFHIKNDGSGNVQQVLSLAAGKKHISFAISNRSGDKLYELAYCTAEDENLLTDLFAAYPVLQHSFYQVYVVYDHPNSVLTPSVSYRPGGSQLLLKTLYGEQPGTNIVSELIPEWQLYNTYTVPAGMQEWINRKFPSATFRHKYSLAVKKINAAGEAGNFLIDFGTDDFTLLAAKESRLLLAQSFTYDTPEDVLYHLLKTCDQFSFSQKEVDIQLSGLIDEQSALYKELYQYFLHISFRKATWDTGDEYPAQFFTLLNDLAQCAS